ncbi:MAG: Hsp20/alpha crystallin family protein [Bacteroidetes bacterium]|nr:MAG: Hsp20/alpha crystallin family protein [Bacteroidota bacterium]
MKLMNRSASLLPGVPRFFDDFFTRDWFDWNANNFSLTNTTIPAVNILETNDDYIVEMAVPGMSKKDFHIEVKDNVLTISSEHKEETEDTDNNRWLLREFSYQSFQRSFRLNNDVVDDAHIKATYKDGMLRLTIPKKEEAKVKPPKLIAVS